MEAAPVKYSDFLSDETLALSPRQRSLLAILDQAVEEAAKWNVAIYVIRAPIYVDEHAEGEHVYSSRAAAAYMYQKRDWMKPEDWSLDARVDASGDVFFTQMQDTLLILGNTLAKERKLNVKLVDLEGLEGILIDGRGQ